MHESIFAYRTGDGMRYLATVSYLGTDFCGFQVQPNVRTVQGVLSEALNALFGSTVSIQGCSRTDSGVHAMGSRVLICTDESAPKIPASRLPLAIAPYLPFDLAITIYYLPAAKWSGGNNRGVTFVQANTQAEASWNFKQQFSPSDYSTIERIEKVG